MNAALASATLPGRMQALDAAGRRWLLDVAHNPASAGVLGKALAARRPAGRSVAMIGLLDDKDVAGVVEPLLAHVDDWIAVGGIGVRALDVGELARQVANLANRACLEAPDVGAALDHVRSITTVDDRILVTGSFYLVGPVLEALELY